VTPGNCARIQQIELEHFRRYETATLHIPDRGLRISGPNGSGKTTILEAILLLSTTRSRRGSLDSDLIEWGSGKELGVSPYARVIGHVEREGAVARIEVFLEHNPSTGKTRKLLRVADRPRRAADVVGILPTVAFSPDDLDLVLGSPAIRRRWLDVVLAQTDRKYLRFLTRYNRILSQRNGLLKQTAGSAQSSRTEFDYWDEQLTGLGSYIVAARAIASRRIASAAAHHFGSLAPEVEDLQIRYDSTLNQPEAWWSDVSTRSSADDAVQRVGSVYEKRLIAAYQSDLERGSTNVGPHRDDVVLQLGNRPLSRFGSRGQQRLAVVAVKLAEVDFMKNETGVLPVFMLDDVLSELDPDHRRTLLQTAVQNGSQLIVTATEEGLLGDPVLTDLDIIHVSAGGCLKPG
jgi:DNA replication and repair protein RecF